MDETIHRIREDFPILRREVYPGIPLIYLDSAATSQKPKQVLEAMESYYRKSNANVHRGVHTLSEEATAFYESSREKVAKFIGAKRAREIVFTHNATGAINLVAYSWGRSRLKRGDLIILTEMEHHSNLVPWYILSQEIGLRLEFVPVRDDGLLDDEIYHSLLLKNPKLVGFTQMSNVLGTITPAKEMISKAHDAGALTIVDGAQSVPHFPINVQDLDVDFLAFSSHKMCGPTGIGVLYGKEKLLEEMPPFMGGGDMIKKVSLGSFIANDIPHKFEAGTPQIAEAIGLGAAVDYLSTISMENVFRHEREILVYAYEKLKEVPGIVLLGPKPEYKGGVLAFVLGDVHPHDVSQVLDRDGIAVRAGHHCAMPLHEKYHIPASTRASLYLYNTKEEIDALVMGLHKVKKIFG